MPYGVRKQGSQYQTVNTATGDVKGTHSSKAEAQAQVNLLRGVKHGWKPTGKQAQVHTDPGRNERTWTEPV